MWPSVTPTAWKDSCLPVNNADSLGHNILAAVFLTSFPFSSPSLDLLKLISWLFLWYILCFFPPPSIYISICWLANEKGCSLKENLRNVSILTRVGTCLVSQIRTDALSVAFGLLWLYPVLMPILMPIYMCTKVFTWLSGLNTLINNCWKWYCS